MVHQNFAGHRRGSVLERPRISVESPLLVRCEICCDRPVFYLPSARAPHHCPLTTRSSRAAVRSRRRFPPSTFLTVRTETFANAANSSCVMSRATRNFLTMRCSFFIAGIIVHQRESGVKRKITLFSGRITAGGERLADACRGLGLRSRLRGLRGGDSSVSN